METISKLKSPPVDLGILGKIIANKHQEVARQKEAVSLSALIKIIDEQNRKKVSFKKALSNSQSGIISEFKRKSPSKGWIHPDADVVSIVSQYEKSGASAISVLTDEQFFGGSFDDFKKARMNIHIPLLRKDFIVDEYQIYQSKAMGADIILLIASALTEEESERFSEIAHQLDMEVLLEIHNEKELDYIQPNIDVVGINNRDLTTFVTDINHSILLGKKIPQQYLKISESGISKPESVVNLRKAGFKGFLMGENFMKTEEPAQTLKLFIENIEEK